MIIDNHNAVNTSGLSIFRDVRQITGISLPNFSEFIFFISLTIFEIWVFCGFKVIVTDETLDGIYTYGSLDKGISDKEFIYLRGIHTRKIFLETVDFTYCFIIKCTGYTLI